MPSVKDGVAALAQQELTAPAAGLCQPDALAGELVLGSGQKIQLIIQ